jgi:hypothetical protein
VAYLESNHSKACGLSLLCDICCNIFVFHDRPWRKHISLNPSVGDEGWMDMRATRRLQQSYRGYLNKFGLKIMPHIIAPKQV